MKQLLKEIRHNPLLWSLALIPVLFACHRLKPESHTLLFVLSVFAIVPLAALLSLATESVAARTGDAAVGCSPRHWETWPSWSSRSPPCVPGSTCG